MKQLKLHTDNITFRNHYNPCFWSALWNSEYFDSIMYSKARKKPPREYKLTGVRFNCNKVLKIEADGLFFERHMGLILTTIKDFRELYFKLPESFSTLSQRDKFMIKYLYWLTPGWGILIDSESLFTALEGVNGNTSVLELVKHGRIKDESHKAQIASFIYTHQLRSPLAFSYNYERNKSTSNPKAYAMLDFIKAVTNTDEMYRKVTNYLQFMWHVYSTNADTFPLADLPITESKLNVIAILSPRHLLVINKEDKRVGIKYHSGIGDEMLEIIYSRIIQNTFKELVLDNEGVLTRILNSKEWKERELHVNSKKSRRA